MYFTFCNDLFSAISLSFSYLPVHECLVSEAGVSVSEAIVNLSWLVHTS